MRHKRGFTLIELMIVIVLIMLLAALVLPTFARARVTSRVPHCQNNLSQIGKAMSMYADMQGVGGLFPTTGTKANPYSDSGGDTQAALSLLYRSYVNDARVFSCPSCPLPNTVFTSVAPTVNGNLPASGHFSAAFPTSFAYSMGHSPNDSMVVIAADKRGTKNRNSDNHGIGAGENCLMAGGNVEFRTTIRNDMGRDDDGFTQLIDADIFFRNPELKHRELDSDCR